MIATRSWHKAVTADKNALGLQSMLRNKRHGTSEWRLWNGRFGPYSKPAKVRFSKAPQAAKGR